jgi:hypothetical protein
MRSPVSVSKYVIKNFVAGDAARRVRQRAASRFTFCPLRLYNMAAVLLCVTFTYLSGDWNVNETVRDSEAYI